MDQLPRIGRDLMWCFSLGDPDDEAMGLFAQLTAAGNLDWVTVVIRNPAISTLRGQESISAYGG